MSLKFGKKPATTDVRDFKFADFVDKTAIPTTWPKPNFGYGTLFKRWLMLGNDQVGDCVIASRAHLTMLDTSVGAAPTAKFTTASVLQTYSDVTGYNPADPSTDQGTNMRVMCKYQKETGLTDANGGVHKIGVYLALTPGDPLHALQATWIFGGFAFGFQVAQSAVDQFNKGLIWDDVGDNNIVGGHEVCGVGTADWTGRLTCISWGRRQEMTYSFIKRYNDESFCYVAPEILNASGTWRGLNIDQLNAELAAL